ncbi:MAG: hypothetical protein OXE05_08795 [Chloroflexi bacterium]|nr:hypothetical protein [Chloroflexota bacterium]
MRRQIDDPNVKLLASIAQSLREDYFDPEEEEAWRGSPFSWIRERPSRQVGKIGEQLVAGWCAAKDLNVLRSPDAEADRIIEEKRVEIKYSRLWKSGRYVFQQFRDQDYEYAICLGLSPFTAHCWVISKPTLLQHVIGHRPQHRGQEGGDTFWLHVIPDSQEPWLQRCGGKLADAFGILQTFR